MGSLKLFISLLLKLILSPLLFICGSIINIRYLNTYYTNLSKSEDKYGNVLGAPVFNKILITKSGYQYGDPDELISIVTAINKNRNTQTKIGIILDKILIFFKDSAFNNSNK